MIYFFREQTPIYFFREQTPSDLHKSHLLESRSFDSLYRVRQSQSHRSLSLQLPCFVIAYLSLRRVPWQFHNQLLYGRYMRLGCQTPSARSVRMISFTLTVSYHWQLFFQNRFCQIWIFSWKLLRKHPRPTKHNCTTEFLILSFYFMRRLISAKSALRR